MKRLREVFAWLSVALDDAAAGLLRLTRMFRRSRRARLVEQPDGAFVAQAIRGRSKQRTIGAPFRIVGGRIDRLSTKVRSVLSGAQLEIALQGSRFIFRPLELPQRAGEFLEGIVAAQIDRLTPWRTADAVFGWSAPKSVGKDRIEILIAATARAAVQDTLDAVEDLRPDSISLTTIPDGAQAQNAPLRLLARSVGEAKRIRNLKRKLAAVLTASGLAAIAAATAWIGIGDRLDAKSAEIARRIADQKVALFSGRGSAAEEALAGLEKRKQSTAASVIVVEALSQVLPDDTYLTDLHIENGQLQIAGLTRDAPALIRLIEQSQHFSRATFFAPTTRSPSDNGERFHIAAHIEPLFPVAQ